MMRGTFGNIRIKNKMVAPKEGGYAIKLPENTEMYNYEAAMKYLRKSTPLIVLGGKEYGTGSSRDWAAKGTILLGIKAVIAESYERIHRNNLVGMGALPLVFKTGENIDSLGLDGTEIYSILGLADYRTPVKTCRSPQKNKMARSSTLRLLPALIPKLTSPISVMAAFFPMSCDR